MDFIQGIEQRLWWYTAILVHGYTTNTHPTINDDDIKYEIIYYLHTTLRLLPYRSDWGM